MSRPLDGVRVLDLGQIYQGGYSGLLMSFLGADVVKVEPPWGENVRTRSEDGKPPQYQFLNVTKRGITLNLKSERGKETLKDLVAEADVLLENFAKGKMAELGVGYETLSEVNPELVYAHGSGYGDDGPYADYPAMDLTVQAMSGVMNTTGYPEQPPVKAGPAICDFMGALHLVVGIVSALYEREATGEGEYIEVGMFDTMFPTLASPIASLVDQNDAPARTGNKHSGLAIAPYNTYEVEDGHVAIICISERHWENLTEVMGRAELSEMEKYSSKALRAQHIDEVDGYIEAWLDGKTKNEVMEILLESNVPSAPVKTVEEIIDDPHLEHRNMIEYLPNQTDGREEMPVPGMPIKFSGAEEPEIDRAPFLGEHTDEILADLTGYSEQEIDELRANDAI
ncbi:CaiB/BaiF CoA transferase family protein [Natronorubrum sp. FCH18a]|uniref:CaiB/BaiF CoA transferase family protein n=1 Tax=Natronorubrum sp. FCH18a TaxID=3447018 RepID=UPI003F5113E3